MMPIDREKEGCEMQRSDSNWFSQVQWHHWRAVCIERCKHGSQEGGRKRATEILPGGSREFLASQRDIAPRWPPILLHYQDALPERTTRTTYVDNREVPSSGGSDSTSHLQQESGSGSTSIQGEATLILCSG
jgi:hypothetical protein